MYVRCLQGRYAGVEGQGTGKRQKEQTYLNGKGKKEEEMVNGMTEKEKKNCFYYLICFWCGGFLCGDIISEEICTHFMSKGNRPQNVNRHMRIFYI